MPGWFFRSRWVMALVLATILFVTGAGQPGAKAKQIHIKAQRLADSLTSVAEIFGLQIAFHPEDVDGIQAPALSGNYTADQAFTVLLEDTPLEHRFVDEDSVAVGPKGAGDKEAVRCAPTISWFTLRGRSRSF